MLFVSIVNGSPYSKTLPEQVVLPESKQTGKLIVTRQVTYKKGQPGWAPALIRWMYLSGYRPATIRVRGVFVEE